MSTTISAPPKERAAVASQGNGDSLGVLMKAPVVELPMASSDLLLLDEAEKRAMGVRSVRDWMITTSLPWLSRVKKTQEKLGSDYLDQEIEVTDGTTKKLTTVREQQVEFEEDVAQFLDHQNLLIRRAANEAFISFRVSQTSSMENLHQTLEDMASEGFLVNDPEGLVQGTKWEQRFSLAKNDERFGYFTDEQEQKFSALVRDSVNHFKEEQRVQFLAKKAELRRRSEISPLDLWNGEPGLCFLEVLEETVDGRVFSKVHILVRQDKDGKIHPEDVAENFFLPKVDEMKQRKVFVHVYFLRTREGRLKKGSELGNLRRPEKYLSPAEFEDWRRQASSIILFRHLLRRALEPVLKRAEADGKEQGAWEDLKSQATVTSKEFFLEEKEGFCAVALDSLSRWINRLLVERWDGKIRIAGFLPHEEESLSDCMDVYEEREKFSGIPEPLGSFLRAGWGQAAREATKPA